MKAWSKTWISSKNRRKQRKYRLNAPKHIRNNLLSSTLSKDLRKKVGLRAIPVRTKDYVKILVGEHKGISGEIIEIDRVNYKIYVNGVTTKKRDGSEIKVAIDPSNVLVTSLQMEDDKRFKRSKLSQKVKDDLKTDRKRKEPKVEKKPEILETKDVKKESSEPKKEETAKKVEKKVESKPVEKKEKLKSAEEKPKVEKGEKNVESKSVKKKEEKQVEKKQPKEEKKKKVEEKEANKNAN